MYCKIMYLMSCDNLRICFKFVSGIKYILQQLISRLKYTCVTNSFTCKTLVELLSVFRKKNNFLLPVMTVSTIDVVYTMTSSHDYNLYNTQIFAYNF